MARIDPLLRETNDEIPNLGFSLSNKKLLRSGFEFLYNLDQNIKEMIEKYPALKIQYEKFLAIYNLVKDDYKGDLDELLE